MSSESKKYIGSVVSVYYDDNTCLQGQLVSIDQDGGTFELKRPFKNGRQLKEAKISLTYDKVSSIKLLKMVDDCDQNGSNHLQGRDAVTNSNKHKNGTVGPVRSEPIAVLASFQSMTCSSSLPQSESASPIRFSNSCKTNGFSRNERWASKNGSDSRAPKFAYATSFAKCNGKRAMHGCGDPVMDIENGFRVSKHNRHLVQPLDLEAMNTDFDFEGNLALFDKFNAEMEEDDERFPKFVEKNYKHYENVISDPSRVTSWTTAPARCKLDNGTSHALYTASRIATGRKDVKIPFLSYEDKQNYLSVAESFLGSDVFHVQTADRLLMFVWTVIDRFEVMVEELVVLTSPIANPLLLNRFVQHFSNRACKTVIYGDDATVVDLPYVRRVSDPRDLPIGDGRLVIALDGQNDNAALASWAKRLPRQTHLICLEQPRKLCAIEHVLMIGVGTDSRNGELLREDSEGLLCVTDVGIPFAWLDPRSSAYLATAFATQMLVLL